MAGQCYSAISSQSLGRAWVHDLPGKLMQAAEAGFEGIEIFHEDLLFYAQQLYDTEDVLNEQKVAAARAIRKICTELNLNVVCLQPFRNFEGLVDPAARAAKLVEAEHWVDMAHALDTGLIAIASSLLPKSDTTGQPERLAEDLAAVADIGAAADPPIRFTYEALCFGTHVYSWQRSAEIVRLAGRPNLGICIDTFNLAGWAYADPVVAGGLRHDGPARLRASLDELIRTVDPADVFYIQVVDAERMTEALVEGHPFYVPDQPARMSWSRACRLFYGETQRGAYMPICDILEALFVRMHWRGWVSAELFSRSLENPAETVPEQHARRAMASWVQILGEFPQIHKEYAQTGTNGADERKEGLRPSASLGNRAIPAPSDRGGQAQLQMALQMKGSKL